MVIRKYELRHSLLGVHSLIQRDNTKLHTRDDASKRHCRLSYLPYSAFQQLCPLLQKTLYSCKTLCIKLFQSGKCSQQANDQGKFNETIFFVTPSRVVLKIVKSTKRVLFNYYSALLYSCLGYLVTQT